MSQLDALIERDFNKEGIDWQLWNKCDAGWCLDGYVLADDCVMVSAPAISCLPANGLRYDGPSLRFSTGRSPKTIIFADGVVINLPSNCLDMPAENRVDFEFTPGDFVVLHVLTQMGIVKDDDKIRGFLSKYNIRFVER